MPQDYDEQSAALSLAYYNAIAEPMDDCAAKTKSITAAKKRMLNAIAQNWYTLHKLAFHPTVQELRFQKYRLQQRWLDKHATRLMKPRKTDKGTILLWGDASARDGFGSGSQMGPVTALYNHILSKCRSAACNCIVIKCDEFRTSKLGLFGEEVIRPPRTDMTKLQKYAKCYRKGKHSETNMHLFNSRPRGCKCYCGTPGCQRKRVIGNRCKECYAEKPWVKHGLAVGKRRVWSRDTISAINIAMRALCVMLGLDLGNFERNEIILDANVAEGETHWEKVFREHGVDVAPYCIISKKMQQAKDEGCLKGQVTPKDLARRGASIRKEE